MTENVTVALHALSQSDLTLADGAEDIRDRTVVDRQGDEIGTISDLMIDENEGKVRFLQVGGGGFLGIGDKQFLIPVDAIASIGDDVVRIDQTREHVGQGPEYQPDLVREPDYFGDVYGWYGYAPYWSAGYRYPAYPYYG